MRKTRGSWGETAPFPKSRASYSRFARLIRPTILSESLAQASRAVLGTTILSNGKGRFGPTDRGNLTGQSGPP